MAGVSRLQYSTDIRLIRVMCSGRVDLAFILRAFSNGMDGVFIGGCRLNECNYSTHGNFHALNTVLLCKRIMAHVGLDPERLKIEFLSSSEGVALTESIDAFVARIETLGPLGTGEGLERQAVSDSLATVTRLVPYLKIMSQEKLGAHLTDPGQYDGLFTAQEIEALLTQVVSYYIAPEACQACGICFKRCPVEAIDGGKNRIHWIDQDRCIKCGSCFEACPPRFGAVRKLVGEPVPPPLPEAQRTLAKKSRKTGEAAASS